MTDPNPSFFARIFMAFGVFVRVLLDAAFAARVARLSNLERAPKPAEPAPIAPPTPARELHRAATDSALQLLALLQREGRFVDFLSEDVASYSDADIGAAARVVHESCRKALFAHLELEAIRTETEGARVEIGHGFSASEVRLVGNVVGSAPFVGVLNHRGWRACRMELPELSDGHDVRVIAPAEVEL